MSKTICLNMIVKNEDKIIERLLDSVISIIDTFCICDTGSTDNTKELILDYFQKRQISGYLIEKDFIDFATNRNYALAHAINKADYILFLDADMVLDISSDFNKDLLTNSAYKINQGTDAFQYSNTRLVSSKLDMKYIGVTHEYLDIKGSLLDLSTLRILDVGDGANKAEKFSRDIRLLEEGLVKEPNNIRYLFYLANSYFDNSGKYKEALVNYQKHAKIVTWIEEEFYNYYRQGLSYQFLNDEKNMIYYFLKAYQTLPTRMESLYELVKYYRINGQTQLAYMFYQTAKNIKLPGNDSLFVHTDIYKYKLKHEFSIIGYYNKYNISSKEYVELFNEAPLNLYDNLISNYKFYAKNLVPFKTISLNEELGLYKASTPSIIKYKDGYGVNIRYVNYTILEDGTYDNDNLYTLNKFKEFSKEFYPKHTWDIKYPFPLKIGVEDIKLFDISGEIYYTGTCLDFSLNNISICGGKYDYKNKIEYKEYFIENQKECEKNWVYLETNNMIYEWFPLKIGFLSQNELKIEKNKDMPQIFANVRGSSNAYKYENDFWFIVHLIDHTESPRIYYHMIVILDADYNLKNYTEPFKLSAESIEYSCGIIVEEDRILISMSEMDRKSYIKIYERKLINNLFYF